MWLKHFLAIQNTIRVSVEPNDIFSIIIKSPSFLKPPTDINITEVGDNTVSLAWKGNAPGYYIFRGQEKNLFLAI